MDIQEKIKYHQDVYARLLDIYIRKNADYGDSFVKVRKKFAIAILVRLNDKMNRLESLFESKEQMVIDESIDDTFIDIANYCIMELMERRIDAEFITENLKDNNDLPFSDFESPVKEYLHFTKNKIYKSSDTYDDEENRINFGVIKEQHEEQKQRVTTRIDSYKSDHSGFASQINLISGGTQAKFQKNHLNKPESET